MRIYDAHFLQVYLFVCARWEGHTHLLRNTCRYMRKCLPWVRIYVVARELGMLLDWWLKSWKPSDDIYKSSETNDIYQGVCIVWSHRRINKGVQCLFSEKRKSITTIHIDLQQPTKAWHLQSNQANFLVFHAGSHAVTITVMVTLYLFPNAKKKTRPAS